MSLFRAGQKHLTKGLEPGIKLCETLRRLEVGTEIVVPQEKGNRNLSGSSRSA